MSAEEKVDAGSPEPEAEPAKAELTEAEIGLARSTVNNLVAKGVKVLALDFDKTIVSVHTAGFWRQGAPELVEHVRPCFKALMMAALDTKLHVCIVTYSMQPGLIKDVLKLVLPKCDTSKILIRANSKDWLPSQGLGAANYGKQQHIAWIVTELFNSKHAIIHPQEIVLLDDDEENVTLALQFGHHAYEIKEEVTMDQIANYVDSIEVKRDIPTTPE